MNLRQIDREYWTIRIYKKFMKSRELFFKCVDKNIELIKGNYYPWYEESIETKINEVIVRTLKFL